MPETKDLIERPKLGFFQRIRKSFLISRINLKKYNKAPIYLRNDPDVVDALIRKNPQYITDLDLSQKTRVINARPEIFDMISNKRQREVFLQIKPDLIQRLSENELMEKIFGERDGIKYMKLLPLEKQVEFLIVGGSYFDYNSSTERKINPYDYKYRLEYFSPEAVEKATEDMVKMAKKSQKYRGQSWTDVRRNLPLLNSMEISKLSPDLQIKLLAIDNELIKTASPEAIEGFIGKNPLFLNMVSSETRGKIIKENPELFTSLTWEKQRDLVEHNYDIRGVLQDKDLLMHQNSVYDKLYNPDIEMVKRNIVRWWGYRDRLGASQLTDNVRDPEKLAELARFEPNVLATTGIINDFTKTRKIGHVFDMFGKQTDDIFIRQALERVYKTKMINNSMGQWDRDDYMLNVSKIILNKKIMSTCSPDTIVKCIEDFNKDNLLDVLSQTYGDDVKDIFKDRPLIEVSQIQNFDIFDRSIREKYGDGLIHNLMSYNCHSSAILGELARDPQKMKNFEMYEKVMDGYYNDSFVDFESKIVNYKMIEELLENVNEADLTPERIDALKLVANDMQMMYTNQLFYGNELSTISLKSLSDLDQYSTKRGEMYGDYVSKITDPNAIKEALCRRFFGMQYNHGKDFTQKTVSVKGMINYYNLEKFINDDRTVNSGEFSQDDLDQLELLTIIDKLDDVEVLKEIYSSLDKAKDIIRPVDFKELREKIPMQYSKELVSSLLTVENAKERAEKGEKGISYCQTEDGFDIVKLNGADFRIMVHSTGMTSFSSNSKVPIPYGMNGVDVWKYLEDGCSTISSCVIEGEMLHSCAELGRIHLGFANVDPKLVIGMSHHDAHVSHSRRELDPNFQYGSVKYNYSDELVRMTADQIEGINETKDVTHAYNEVAMYRRDTDATGIENGTYGGKVMPDYIIVYGEAGEHEKSLARAFGKDGKPIPIIEIDRNAYYDRTYMRAMKKEDHTVKRENGNWLSGFKNSVENAGDER